MYHKHLIDAPKPVSPVSPAAWGFFWTHLDGKPPIGGPSKQKMSRLNQSGQLFRSKNAAGQSVESIMNTVGC